MQTEKTSLGLLTSVCSTGSRKSIKCERGEEKSWRHEMFQDPQFYEHVYENVLSCLDPDLY